MDISRFSDKQQTGLLVQIKTPTGPDHAFVPRKLPPSWEFPIHLWPKVVEARTALSELNGIAQTLPDSQLLLRPLQIREAITSSRIEGTYATAEELMLFEIDPHESKSKRGQVNAWREVANYSNTLNKGIELLETLPFCGRVFKELHEVLMRGVRGQHSQIGAWRTYQVAIGSDRRYIPPPAKPEMEQCINEFEDYINEKDERFDPLVRAYIAHYQFEAVHPFGDGNGRIGRVLLSLMTAHWCKLQRPWLYMSEFFERFKDEYIGNLFRVSAEGAWERWIEFCLIGTIQQARDAIDRCQKLRELRCQMLEKVRPNGSPRTEQIVEKLFSNPLVRVSELKVRLNISYPTAQNDVDRLVKADILRPLPDIRPKTFFSSEIMRIAYEESSRAISLDGNPSEQAN